VLVLHTLRASVAAWIRMVDHSIRAMNPVRVGRVLAKHWRQEMSACMQSNNKESVCIAATSDARQCEPLSEIKSLLARVCVVDDLLCETRSAWKQGPQLFRPTTASGHHNRNLSRSQACQSAYIYGRRNCTLLPKRRANRLYTIAVVEPSQPSGLCR
jgi:hypothetical protein